MDVHERLKMIRKTLDLKQEDFGKKINLTKFAISNYENKRNNIPDRVLFDICRVFNVTEQWFRTGEGEMFIEPLEEIELDELLTDIIADNDNSNEIKDIIKIYMKLDKNSQIILKDLANSLLINRKG